MTKLKYVVETFTKLILVAIFLGVSGLIGLVAIAILFSSNNTSSGSQNTTTEEHYQQAVTLVDQAEKLVNQPKTPAELALGEQTLNQAKNHIDTLPTSEVISSPRYSYRKGRQYVVGYDTQRIDNEQFTPIRSKFEQLESKLAEQKDTQKRTSKLIEGAKEFSLSAAKLGQNPPHTAANWQQIEELWQEAINRLSEVSLEDPNYLEAQKLLTQYKTNLAIVHARRQAEEESVTTLEQAEEETNALLNSVSTAPDSVDNNQVISQMQQIIMHLNKVKTGTTAYPKSQELLLSAHKKLKQLQSHNSKWQG